MRTILIIFVIGFLISSCLPADAIPAAPTLPPSETPLPTPSVVWFPPSATPTFPEIVTAASTPEMKPGIGALILNDDFSDFASWDTAVSDQGSAAISRNRLTIVVQPGIYLASLRHDLAVGNFYAEITARTSTCRGDDNYGLIIRAVGNSFYRFALACNGLIFVERVKTGTRLTIFEPVASGDAPPGAPGEARIGIWAVNAEMRVFLNGRFQFSLIDKSFPNGGFGVYARSAGDTPVTVTFSDLIVYDVTYEFPTRTPSP
ncbi:MAG: hypothetical protein IT315_05975, partial [Anaerolineales bacterium]|nr:hypothetical protein [Anaerolineales bacterium]